MNQLATKLLTADHKPANFDTGDRAVLMPQLGKSVFLISLTMTDTTGSGQAIHGRPPERSGSFCLGEDQETNCGTHMHPPVLAGTETFLGQNLTLTYVSTSQVSSKVDVVIQGDGLPCGVPGLAGRLNEHEA